MQRFQGLIGIALIIGLAFLASNNRKKINYRLVFSGILLQTIIAVLIFKVKFVGDFFRWLGLGMERFEGFARQGAAFVYSGINVSQSNGSTADYLHGGFVFVFNVTITIFLV